MQQVKKLHKKFDELQIKHGNSSLSAVYGAGCVKNPRICFVFMNPTMRNIASSKKWKGLRAQWIGTKNIWNFLSKTGLFDKKINDFIQSNPPDYWDYNFTNNVYRNIQENSIYITNLSKSTQKDARPLKNNVFKEYLPYLNKEISTINPKIIISFGNQVSSILLNKNIKVSNWRKKGLLLEIKKKRYPVYPVYYPVGQGMRNIKKAIEDLKYIIKKENL